MKFFFLCLIVSLALVSCGRQNEERPLARIGSATLTMEQARRAIDTSQAPFEAQLPAYVAEWVTNELLFQEAQKSGLENQEQVKRQIEDARRHFAIEALLDQKIYSDTGGIADRDIHAYFENHASEFIAREDMLKLNIVGVTDRDAANSFAASVAKGGTWSAAEARLRADSVNASSMISNAESRYFSQTTIFPQELWKVAAALNQNEVSYPVKTTAGYFVMQLLGEIQQGKPADEEIARDEIRGRLLIERRRQKYDEFVGTLRKQYNVEVFMNTPAPSDSTRFLGHE